MIKENLENVERRICEACERSGRKREDVTLVAVSKTYDSSCVLEAYDAGAREFGENRVQELTQKQDELKDLDIRWHLIGHLQKNKVKYIIGRTALIHSVDSFELAEMISRKSEAEGIVTDILVEINIGDESSKFGVKPEEALKTVEEMSVLKGIHIRGLMAVAPITDDPENNRKYFRRMRDLAVDIGSKNIDNVTMYELSMGMTGDFETAIEEGATIVRIGTAIFGKRQYNI